jgi:mediator of RNA polymerase II transcription subunit 20
MGVSVLQAYPVPHDKTAAQVIELIQKRIVNLGAIHTGQFLVDCETYLSSPNLGNPPRTLNVLHNSEQPATVFSVLEHSERRTTFTSDTLFDLLLLKLSNVYSKKLRIESKGPRFEIGDFVVKLGVVSIAGSYKGILVEVEYLPCHVIQSCWGLVIEFMQGFLGSVVSSQVPPYLKSRCADNYTPVDTIHQYLENFNAFRKGGAGNPAPTLPIQQ